MSKSSSESGKSSDSVESKDEEKSNTDESNQLQYGYDNLQRLNLNSEPNSLHDNTFEDDEGMKNVKTMVSAGNPNELMQVSGRRQSGVIAA